MGLKEQIAQPQGAAQHEQDKPGDQEVGKSTFPGRFVPAAMLRCRTA